jgi:hypothetical protein
MFKKAMETDTSCGGFHNNVTSLGTLKHLVDKGVEADAEEMLNHEEEVQPSLPM